MSHFLDRLIFFRKDLAPFSDGQGIVASEKRAWEDGYRKRWHLTNSVWYRAAV
jgi:nitrate reductase alpha subunit